MDIFIAIVVVLLLSVVLIFFRVRVYRYELTDFGLVVSLFGVLKLMTVPYKNMVGVRVIRSWDLSAAGWWPLLLKNRFSLDVVLINVDVGFFRSIVITPDSPQDFVEKLLKCRR